MPDPKDPSKPGKSRSPETTSETQDSGSALPVGVPPHAVALEFVRSRGPGGQNVNKVNTAVQLRLNVGATQLPYATKQRLLALAGSRATKDGWIVLRAERFRTQSRNRAEAFERLRGMIRDASHVPKHRRPTKPSAGARKRRMDRKGQRGAVKKLRRPPTDG